MTTPTRTNGSTSALRIYLRQSEDEEKQSSTQNQQPPIDRAVAELRRQGVVTDGMPVVRYEDIGGARYDFTRPDYLRFMGDVGKGDVVVIAWRDRLGSGSRYVVAVEDIVKVGGARLFIADPTLEEIKWNQTTGLTEAIYGNQSEAYIEELKKKTRAALRRQLAAGYAANDVGLGFRTEIDPATRRVVSGVETFNKRIVVDDNESATVLRIFELKASGMGWLSMVKALNSDGARTARGGLWNTSTLWDVLHNRKYIGEWTMGERKVVKKGGLRVVEAGDDPIVVKLPHLAFVPRELWDRAHAVIAAKHTDMRGKVNRTTHLLSGIMRCRECGGGLSTSSYRTRKGSTVHSYICSRYRTHKGCDVRMYIPAERLEAEILAGTADQILGAAAEMIQRIVRDVVAQRTSQRGVDASGITRELEAARGKLQKARKLAYATEDDSDETIAMLKRLGEAVKELEAQHARATAPADEMTPREIERQAMDRIADLRTALANKVTARAALHRIFPQGISVRLTDESYEIEGGADLDLRSNMKPSGCRTTFGDDSIMLRSSKVISDFHLIALQLGSEEQMLERAIEALQVVEAGETAFLPEYLAWTPHGSGRAFARLVALAQSRNINVVTTLNVAPDLHEDLPGRDANARYNALVIFTRHGSVHVPQAKVTPQSFEMDVALDGPQIGVRAYDRINRVQLDWQDSLIDARFLIGSDLAVLTQLTPAQLACDLFVVLGNFASGAERAASRLLGLALAAGATRTALHVNAFDVPRAGRHALANKVEEVLEATRRLKPRAKWPSPMAIRSAFHVHDDERARDFVAMCELPRRGRIAVARSRWQPVIVLGEYPITVSL